ncbi:RICIN domain-containing protein [Streptomyces sp. NPDC050703]
MEVDITDRRGGKRVDVRGGSGADNARVVQWTCNGRGNQYWTH